MAKCGETIRIKNVCRNRKGEFTRKGRTAKKRMKKGAACKPSSVRRYKGRCGCKTVGGGFKLVPKWRCTKKRKKR